MAAGLSLPEENIDAFREQMNRNCPLTVEQLQPKVYIDVPMPVDYVTNALVEEFHILAPFGKESAHQQNVGGREESECVTTKPCVGTGNAGVRHLFW